ncbi:MAG: hypothetical protein JXM69_18365 [Anaerolineae bacterium]|nr:hypothetical protein [Anaerolineae bacterium]
MYGGYNFTQTKVKKYLQKLEERIEGYLQELDKADGQHPVSEQLTPDQLQVKIEQLQARQEKYQGYLSSNIPWAPSSIGGTTAIS